MGDSTLLEFDFDFNVYVNSKDSLDKFPANKFYDFRIALPKTFRLLHIKNYKWVIQVLDLTLLKIDHSSIPIPESIVVLLDLLEPCVINSTFRPVLQRIWKVDETRSFDLVQAPITPLRITTFNTLHIRVLTDTLGHLDLAKWQNLVTHWNELQLSCLLNFQLHPKAH